MFIIKFNKMIHNKWVWGVFAFIVAFAFAGAGIFTERSKTPSAGGMGLLGGERVSLQEYDLVRRMLDMEEQSEGAVEEQTDAIWQRLAVLKTARDMGLRVTDEEIMGMLQRDPAFAGQNGTFDPALYRAMVSNALGIPTQLYEDIRRSQLLASHLEAAILSAGWVPPSVASEQARGLTDRYTVCVATISNQFATAAMPMEESDLAGFYTNNLMVYREPEQVSVRYVAFEVGSFKDKVEVQEDAMRDYYDTHADKYSITTNDVTTPLPFEEAKSIVESELKVQGARDLMADAAADFADIFYQSRKELGADAFERLAAEQSLAVHTTEYFAVTSAPVGIDRQSSFAQAAFDLSDENPRDMYSDAVVGETAAYVLALNGRLEEHVPELEKIHDRVSKDAEEFSRVRAFSEYVDKIRGSIKSEMENEREFGEVVAELGLTLGTNMVVTAFEAFQQLPAGQSLAMQMIRMNPGEVSPAVMTEDGAAILQVVTREAGEELQLAMMSQQMVSQLRDTNAELVRDEWRRFILDNLRSVASESVDEDAVP